MILIINSIYFFLSNSSLVWNAWVIGRLAEIDQKQIRLFEQEINKLLIAKNFCISQFDQMAFCADFKYDKKTLNLYYFRPEPTIIYT